MKAKFYRKGFTLVELLIVIVVIGVLSAMMMLSSTEAVSSAKASNIISGLRNMKTAILSWYADNSDRVKKDKPNDPENPYKIDKNVISEFLEKANGDAEILKYLNNVGSISLKRKNKANNQGDYTINGANYSAKWYVCYNVGNDSRVKEKLKSRASSIGLLGVDNVNQDFNTGFTGTTYNNEKYVAMFVLSIED